LKRALRCGRVSERWFPPRMKRGSGSARISAQLAATGRGSPRAEPSSSSSSSSVAGRRRVGREETASPSVPRASGRVGDVGSRRKKGVRFWLVWGQGSGATADGAGGPTGRPGPDRSCVHSINPQYGALPPLLVPWVTPKPGWLGTLPYFHDFRARVTAAGTLPSRH